MNAPMSPEIASLLQNPQTARELMDAVLASRDPRNSPDGSFGVMMNGKTKRYKPVTAIQRSK